MEKEENSKRNQVLVYPYPVQGHINPMLQFSKRLALKGLKVTLVTTEAAVQSAKAEVGLVTIKTFRDFWDETKEKEEDRPTTNAARYQILGSRCLTSLVEEYSASDSPVKYFVYDSMMPWGLDFSNRHGLISASFFTQSLAVNAIYYYLESGFFSVPVNDPPLTLPGLATLEIQDLPSFIGDNDQAYPTYLKYVLDQFTNVEHVDFLLFNTFDKLEEEIVSSMEKRLPGRIVTIGPTLPSTYLDKRIEGDDDYGLHIFKPDSSTCMKWLDAQETGSVVYVAFGSMVSVGDEVMEELAWGLRTSGKPFLWVVRESEQKKLPSNFADDISEKGLLVGWCPQLEVLAHRAIGCFITHCGWNSTLEALSFGVPMVAMPQWTDQLMNAKYVQDVWKVGVRVKVNEKGIVGREEIKRCIQDVLEGENGKETKRNSTKFKEFAKEAVSEGGSSDLNFDNIVSRLLRDSQ